MSNDPFSDVLRLTEAKSVVSGGYAVGGTWAFRLPAPGQIVFSAIAKGSCCLRLDHHRTTLRLEQGDVGLLSGRDGFRIGSSLTAPAIDVVPGAKSGGIVQVGDRDDCVVLFGRVSLHPSSASLFTGLLPASVHIRASSARAGGLRWLVDQLVDEQTSTVPGASVASEKLAELLFVQILRAHVSHSKTIPSGWLRAITDDRIVRALRLMHGEPARAWRLGELAQAAGMSRTRFAVLFKSLAGSPPLDYLGQWRMRLAERSLREEDTPISELGASLGYTSESAFSNAFKRITGTAPRNYRVEARRKTAS